MVQEVNLSHWRNLEKEIHKGFNLTFQELQMMSNQTITLQNI